MPHLSLEEREILENLLNRQISLRKIAKRLERSHSSISAEIKRNHHNGYYNATKAHQKYLYRKHNKSKRSKIEISPGLKQFIINQLINEQWSPVQIDRYLRIKSGGKCVVSHETIYLFIYSKEGKKLKLFQHLRRKKRPKRQAFRSRKNRTIIPERVSIHRRQKSINLRSTFGHWEVDLMIFSNQKLVLATAVERLSRFTIATILPNKTALEMKRALRHFILDYGQLNFKSISFDNGTENVLHHELKHEFPGLETFFCDPYCSWQKGSIENANLLLRQYLPRSTDLGKYSQDNIDFICSKINNRPRKCLNFLNSKYVFNKHR